MAISYMIYIYFWYVYACVCVCSYRLANRNQGQSEGSLFNSYDTVDIEEGVFPFPVLVH